MNELRKRAEEVIRSTYNDIFRERIHPKGIDSSDEWMCEAIEKSFKEIVEECAKIADRYNDTSKFDNVSSQFDISELGKKISKLAVCSTANEIAEHIRDRFLRGSE